MDLTPFTWSTLATVAGASAAAMVIVQIIKEPLDRLVKIPTRWLVWLISFVLLLLAQLFTAGLAWANLPLLIVNAFLATFAAMGGYEATFATKDREKAAAAAKKGPGKTSA